MRPIANSRPIVQLRGVTHAYASRKALDKVDLALYPGELTFLVGPSGAGKTTLLRLINRESRPTSGEVWVAGIGAHELKAPQVPALRRRVGVVWAILPEDLEAFKRTRRPPGRPRKLVANTADRASMTRTVRERRRARSDRLFPPKAV